MDQKLPETEEHKPDISADKSQTDTYEEKNNDDESGFYANGITQ